MRATASLLVMTMIEECVLKQWETKINSNMKLKYHH